MSIQYLHLRPVEALTPELSASRSRFWEGKILHIWVLVYNGQQKPMTAKIIEFLLQSEKINLIQ